MLRVALAVVIFVSAIGILVWNGGGSEVTAVAGSPYPQPHHVVRGHLTHAGLEPGQSCPVTDANGSGPYPAELSDTKGDPLRTWYGHGDAWVQTPRFTSSTMLDDGEISTNIQWFIAGPGQFHITARRLDGTRGTLRTRIADIYPRARGQVVQTEVILSGLGCWDIAGYTGTTSVEWIFEPSLKPRFTT